eukprot:NODE_704_length_4999_cov_0.292653.p4 type:complete len:107 gc:universal NODE_704_length_4999_cov_0.292653:867-547(-)
MLSMSLKSEKKLDNVVSADLVLVNNLLCSSTALFSTSSSTTTCGISKISSGFIKISTSSSSCFQISMSTVAYSAGIRTRTLLLTCSATKREAKIIFTMTKFYYWSL